MNPLLKAGVSHAAANAALQPLVDQFQRETPKVFPQGQLRVRVAGLNEWVTKGISRTLYLLMAGVALLLAIGCGNVSILLLARGAARRHELGVRTALGASRMRLIRQLLTESLAVSLCGALLGVGLAHAMLAALKTVLPQNAFAPEVVIRLNIPVLIFSVVVSIATGVIFGLWPAFQLSGAAPAAAGFTSRRVAGSVHHRRSYSALIAGQVALTLVLLTLAGSALRGFLRLLNTPLGYEPRGVISMGIPLRQGAYAAREARITYFEALLARTSETPGVTAAAISLNATPPDNGWNARYEVSGMPHAAEQNASLNMVGPGFFPLLRSPTLEGRIWTEAENHNGAHVAVVNQTFARLHFPNGGAVGKSIRLPELRDLPPRSLTQPGLTSAWLTIVGVAGDACNDGLRKPVRPAIYIPWTLDMEMGTQILVRSPQGPTLVERAVKKQIALVNPDQQADRIRDALMGWISSMPEWQQQRLTAWIFGLFAIFALVLAALGLYSVVSWTVVQRTNEIGIRIALGAGRRDVQWTVCVSAMASIAAGMAAGLVLSAAASRLALHWFAGASGDWRTMLAGALVLAAVGWIACLGPARRACIVDPAVALRFE